MHYFEVAVEQRGLREHDTLTYSHENDIPIGSIVRAPLKNSAVNGVVIQKTSKPEYKTRGIKKVIEPAALSENHIALAKWMSDYYSTGLSQAISMFLPRGAHKSRRESKSEDIKHSRKSTSNLKLSEEQSQALKHLAGTAKTTAILHGVTGSGKTRLYIERARQTIEQGEGVIVLVPEIGLTAQIVADFKQALKQVFVLHSQQSESMRHKQWKAILEADTPVVIGPRSALFSPVSNLGLIVVDEEHETSYKQDQTPKYHAVRVASQMSKLFGARLILGSATPRIEDYYLARHTESPIIRLKHPIRGKLYKTDVKVVDLRDRSNFASSKLFSNQLIKTVRSAIEGDGQVLLFHNRRGTSTSVVCMNCGWLAQCPNCTMPLTHHGDWQKLVCHICGHREPVKMSCPECKKAELMYKGIGTKQIASEAAKLFPGASIARFDGDNLKDERLHERYQEIYDGGVDIIVGTQMVAKGIDLPKLSAAGVVMADTALHIPDYSANERAFQLLYQVIGRAGRHRPGSAIIQSYTPEHTAIEAAVKRDYEFFYEHEIKEREITNYPPFSHILLLVCERKSAKSAQDSATKLADRLNKEPGIKVLGPSPAFYERNRDKYRWQIVVKSKKRALLQQVVEQLPANWNYDLDPINLI